METTGEIVMPHDHYVKVDSINTRYWRAGDAGDPVVLVHGFSASVEYWGNTLEALSATHRVFACDLIGLGRTDKPRIAYTSAQFARFVAAFMDAVGVPRAHVVGHSLGGAVTMDLAIHYPERINKLVLVSPAGLARALPLMHRLATLPFVGEGLLRPTRRNLALLIRAHAYVKEAITDEFLDSVYAIALQPGMKESLLAILRANANCCGARPEVYKPLVRQLKNITAPTLIVWGNQDRVLPAAQATVALKRLPNARLALLDQCGHIPQLEQSERFNRLVVEFL